MARNNNIICPRCGAEMQQIDSLVYTGTPDEFERLRIYECPRCEYRVKTSEEVIAEDVEYRTLRD